MGYCTQDDNLEIWGVKGVKSDNQIPKGGKGDSLDTGYLGNGNSTSKCMGVAI